MLYFSNNVVDFIIIILLTQNITISSAERYEQYYFHGRGKESSLSTINDLLEEKPNEILFATRSKRNLMIKTGEIVRRSAEFNNMLETSNSDDKEFEVQFTTLRTTTGKSPFGLFNNFGGNGWFHSSTTKRPISEEDSHEEEKSTDRIIHEDGRPCDHNHQHHPYFHPPPTTTASYPPPFYGGFRFGEPPENPFANNNNKNNNNFFNAVPNNNNANNNPSFRGGIIVGNPPQLDNPLITKSSEKDEEKPSIKAKFWCERYQTMCSSKEEPTELRARIIGGNPAAPKEHTHMVLVGYGSPDDKHWLCGGSLVSPKFVLSAAHCTRTTQWGKARWARLGELDLSTRNDDASPQERMIIKRYNHPDYKEPAVYNDIAIYKLDSEITVTDWVSPVCLQTTADITLTQVVVTGWGRTAFVGETSPVLMEVQIGLYNDSECKKLMNSTNGSRLPKGIDTRMMLCAGVREGGKDACSGDSGGPLITEAAKCSKTQVGITSIGRECGLPNSPGIYTRISYFIPWIASIVWP